MVNTNLDYLHRKLEGLTVQQRDFVSDHLVGWFSSFTSTAEWKQAVDAALESAEHLKALRAAR